MCKNPDKVGMQYMHCCTHRESYRIYGFVCYFTLSECILMI